ncbi:hypothetical protein DV096_03365 [Bradymonadaceae bacterium TMQ3]|nr:hypothetical protein DV096_03365 [Bradymonadaceae bacterium TMQ3]
MWRMFIMRAVHGLTGFQKFRRRSDRSAGDFSIRASVGPSQAWSFAAFSTLCGTHHVYGQG